MTNQENSVPQNEEEAFVEYYNNLSKYIAEKLKEVTEKDRLSVLKILNPSDLSLMNLHLLSLKNEDYEICDVAITLLNERGINFNSEKW